MSQNPLQHQGALAWCQNGAGPALYIAEDILWPFLCTGQKREIALFPHQLYVPGAVFPWSAPLPFNNGVTCRNLNGPSLHITAAPGQGQFHG